MSTVPEPRGIRCADVMHEPGEALTRDLVAIPQIAICATGARVVQVHPARQRRSSYHSNTFLPAHCSEYAHAGGELRFGSQNQ